ATALALTWSGWGAALVAGFAVALSPDLRVVSLFAATEAQFAFLVMLLFVALARRWPPLWIGVLCGLAYLTRYNGGLLLPLALILLADRPRFARTALHGIAGFLVVCVPWWVRNLTVTGDPFFSLYALVVHSPLDLRTNSDLLHVLDPPSTFPTAGLLNKLRITLPTAFLHSPLLLANLPAALGVLIGAAQRDRWCVGLLAIAVAMTAIGATVGALGRYAVPLLPVLLVLGVVRWWRLDVRIRAPALLLLLLAPALPSVAD